MKKIIKYLKNRYKELTKNITEEDIEDRRKLFIISLLIAYGYIGLVGWMFFFAGKF